MNLEERLSRISAARKRMDNDSREKLESEAKKRNDYMSYFDKFSNRIADIINVAEHLQRNRILLGKKKAWDKVPTFVSDGIGHGFGFVCDGNPYFDPYDLKILGVGYHAGGCCGHKHHVMNQCGFVSFSDYFYNTRGRERLEKDFLEFEKGFYDYVDSL